MATTIEEKILAALRTTGRPTKALDIARTIGGGCSKKEVNQVIHKMKGVERANPGENPPLWLVAGSGLGSGGGSSAAASTAPSEGATNFSAREPVEAARTRGGHEAAGLASQLAKVTLGDEKSATLDNKLLATIEQTEAGFLISAIPRDPLINRALGASHGPEQPLESRPVQETGSPNHGPDTSGKNADSSSKKKVDPINLNSGYEQLLENEKIEDNPSSKEKDLAAKVLEDNSPGGGAAKSEGASADKAASTPTAKTKKKPMIAANFGGVAIQEEPNSALKKNIIDILQEEAGSERKEKIELSTWDITKRLGHENRIKARQMLEELKKEGKVYDVVRDEISYWGIRNQE